MYFEGNNLSVFRLDTDLIPLPSVYVTRLDICRLSTSVSTVHGYETNSAFIHAFLFGKLNAGNPKSNAVYQVTPRIKVKITDHNLKLQLSLINQCICSLLFVYNTAIIRLRTSDDGILLLYKSQECGVGWSNGEKRHSTVTE